MTKKRERPTLIAGPKWLMGDQEPWTDEEWKEHIAEQKAKEQAKTDAAIAVDEKRDELARRYPSG